MRTIILPFFLLFACYATAQDIPDPDFREKRLAAHDTMVLDSVSINSSFFEVFLKNGHPLDSTAYDIDYGNAVFSFRESKTALTDTLIFKYRVYPQFLTQRYFLFDRDKIVESTGNAQKAYALSNDRDVRDFTPFEGLQTSGSIVRGITVG
ncbi:MAG: hypothetical protein V7767_03735, partial [Leeuwenhoekiella sp.]